MPIPDELKAYPQWICWLETVTDKGGKTKLPYNPITGQLASVTDPASWTTYDVASSQAHRFSGLGFVLTEADPYTFIDLDSPTAPHLNYTLEKQHKILSIQERIVETFDTYSERSPSKKGLHLLCRGLVTQGRRRDCIEIYSSLRYMTITGDTYIDKPILERQSLITTLWDELSPPNSKGKSEFKDQPQTCDDLDIYNQASNAENGNKFLELWRGQWEQYYPSQSQADFALINILSFYSRNKDQILRLFLQSALGQRDKAKRVDNYLLPMIKRSFDNLPPEIDVSKAVEHAKEKLELAVAANPFSGSLFAGVPDPEYDWTVPPGLLGEVAQFIYSAVPRPVKEVALAASIGLMAGICGRSYNVSGTGLNQYILVLANTGTGKEGASKGIERIMETVKTFVPAALDFIGPSEIASGPALIKYLNKQVCFVSIVGEFGLLLQQMCSAHANAPQATLRRTLLDLYNKSGAGDVLRPTIYSDKDKNTAVVHSPAFTLLGESIPDAFYKALDETMILQGLFPRFTVIEYTGRRPELNRFHKEAEPSAPMIQRLCELATSCLQMIQHGRVIHIAFDPDGTALETKFDKFCDNHVNGTNLEIARQLWTRAHMKALKLAGLIAVGVSPTRPVVIAETMQWAIDVVSRDITNVMGRFERGAIGLETSESGQIEKVRAVIAEFMVRPIDATMKKYGVVDQMKADNTVPHQYIQRKLLSNTEFQKDRMGATAALKRAVDSFVTEGSLLKLKDMQMYQRYQKTCTAYSIADPSRFIHR